METTPDAARARTRPITLGVIAAVIAFVIAAVVFTTQQSRAEAPATLKALKPAVSVRSEAAGPFKVVSGTTPANEGAAIRTDATGMAEVSYFDGSHTRLGPATEYTLTKLARNGGQKQLVGNLEIGRSYHRVTAVTGTGSRFEVKTSNATAAVRGTAFTVVCLVRGVCEITVIEGAVALLDPVTGEPLLGQDGRPIILQAGQAITVTTLPDGSTLLSDVHPADLSDPFLIENAQLDDLDLLPPSVRGVTQTPDGEGGVDGAAGPDGGTGGEGAGRGGDAPGAGGGDGAGGTPPASGGGDTPGQGPPSTTPGQGPPTTTPGQGPPTTTSGQGPPATTPGQGPPSSTTTTTTQPTTTTTTQPTTTTCPGGGYPPRPC